MQSGRLARQRLANSFTGSTSRTVQSWYFSKNNVLLCEIPSLAPASMKKTRMGSEILLELQVEVIQRVAAFPVQILALPARSPFAAKAGQAPDGFAQSTHLFLPLTGVSAAQSRPRFGQPLPELPTRP